MTNVDKSLRSKLQKFLKISRPTIEKKEVDESSYQEAITKLKNMYAEQVDITDRGVKEGDFILVDVEDLDSPKAEKVFSNTRFEVAKGKISEWMNEAVLGKKVISTSSFSVLSLNAFAY